MENITKKIRACYPVSNEAMAALTQCLEMHTFPAKTLIVKAGRFDRNVYFIERGITRSFILRTRRLLARLNATDYADTGGRQALLREMLGSMGRNVHVDIDFHCEYGKHIFIEDNVIINMNCTFVDNNRIDIGSNVLIAPNVQIYTATHSTKVAERMVADAPDGGETCRTIALPVKIEDGVWIGGGSIILPGVTVGRGSVIGAGSVVTRSIPADCVAVGNPCRVIKQIDNGGGAL